MHLRYVYTALLIVFLIGAGLFIEKIMVLSGASISLGDTRGPGQVLFYALGLSLIIVFQIFVMKVDILDFAKAYAVRWRTAVKGFLIMFAFASIIAIVGYIVLIVYGKARWSSAAWHAMTMSLWLRVLVAVLVVFVLASTEELIFRSVLMRNLRWNTSVTVTVLAVVVSSAIFSASHLFETPQDFLTTDRLHLLIGLFLLGVLLSVAYLTTGSLLCSIGIHTGLLGSKVVIRKTEWLHFTEGSTFLGKTADLRESPVVWCVFILMIIALLLVRSRTNRALAVERPVVGREKVTYDLPYGTGRF